MSTIVKGIVHRDVRLEQNEQPEGAGGYLALYLTDHEGQWNLAVDGTYGNDEERMEVHSTVLDLLIGYLKAGVRLT